MAKKKTEKKARCAGYTKAGKRCKNFAAGRSKYCASHKTAKSRGKKGK